MTDNNYDKFKRVRGASADVRRFRAKFDRNPNLDMRGNKQKEGPRNQKSDILNRLRARIKNTIRTGADWTVGNPAKTTPNKDRITYRVRNGKLFVLDGEGNTVAARKERGLNKYNGLTLNGKPNKKGEIKLESGLLNKRKLKQGNAYDAPWEEQQRVEGNVASSVAKASSVGQKIFRLFKNKRLKQGLKKRINKDDRKRRRQNQYLGKHL